MGTPLRSDGHWSVQGLIHILGLNENAGATAYDLASQYPAPITGAKWEAGSLRWPSNATTECVIPQNIPVTDNLTVFVKAAASQQVDTSSGHIFSRHPGWFISCRASAPTGLRFGLNTGSEISVPIVSTVPINTMFTAAATYNGAAVKTYYNGSFANEAAKTGNINLTGSTRVGKYWNSNVDTWRGLIDAVFAYNRALSAEEIKSLTENPWQIYQPRTVWVPVAASGGGTTLTIANSSHSHISESIIFTQNHILAVDGGVHSHIATDITLGAAITIAIASASHGHVAQALTLSQQHLLAIANSLHTHNAQNVVLISGLSLDISNGSHGVTSTNITLSTPAILQIQSAAHGVISGDISLTQLHKLIIQNTVHSLLSSNIAFAGAATVSFVLGPDRKVFTTIIDLEEIYKVARDRSRFMLYQLSVEDSDFILDKDRKQFITSEG